MKAEIIYKGSVIATLSEGQSMTLHCEGERLTDDIVVRAVSTTLISFTIDGVSYQAEQGMTWADWIADTTLNTVGAYLYKKTVHLPVEGEKSAVKLDGLTAVADSLIIENAKYYLGTHVESGGAGN